MSMILEALRKSEAERQRGRAPGLFVEQRPARARERRVPGWAWSLGALLLAVLLAWVWRDGRRPLLPAVPEPVADQAAPASSPQNTPRVERKATGSDALAPITLPPRPSPEPAAALARPAETAAGKTARAPTEVPPVETSRAAAATEPGVPPPADALPYVPGLAALPASERAALPPLKLSMHVFNADPAQRFVILDGQRLGQGASPVAGVVLEEIRRDGLVLSVNGQRLLLARP